MVAHVRKKVDALGNFVAKIVGIDVGLPNSCGSDAIIPDASVTIKNECYRPKVLISNSQL